MCAFFGFVLLTWKFYLKRTTFELYSKRSPKDIRGLISRTQHEKLISEVELALVCAILAEAVLGNEKATY